MKQNRNVQKYFKYFFGILISGFGIVFVFKSNLGSASTSTMTEGLANSLHISEGNANIILNLGMLLTIVILDRTSIGIGSVLSTFTFGAAINIANFALMTVQTPNSLLIKIIFCLLGIILQAFGITYYMKSDIGYGPLELLTNYLTKSFEIDFSISKVIVDAVLMVVGFVLGGVIGLGTILATFLTGYFIGIFDEKL